MKKVLSLVLVIAMVLSSMSFAFAGTFEDVTGDYEEAIDTLVGLGVVTGYEDGTYRPGQAVTRAEMAKLMVEILGYGDLVAGAKSNFTDTQGHWADAWIALAAGRGIVVGTGDGKFAPDRTVTYNEVLTMIVRGLGYTDDSNEIKSMTWPTNFKVKAAELGITDGVVMNTTGADRGGVAQALYNALETALVTVNTDGNIVYLKGTGDIPLPLVSRLANYVASYPVTTETLNSKSKNYGGNIIDLAPYMYQSLEVYVSKTDRNHKEVVYIIDTNSVVLEGTVVDVLNASKDSMTATVPAAGPARYLVVEDANEDEFRLEITGALTVYYNGKAGTVAVNEVKAKLYDDVGAKVTVIVDDYNGNDNGVVNNDEDIFQIVATKATRGIQVRNDYKEGKLKIDGVNGSLSLPNEDGKVSLGKINVSGAVEDLTDITVDDVVVAYYALDNSRVDLVVSREVVKGTVNKSNTDGDTIYIDGTKYEISEVLGNVGALAVSSKGEFFLDNFGKVFAFDGSEDLPKDYAIVIGAVNGTVSDKFGLSVKDYPEIKLATEDNETIVYKVYVDIDATGEVDGSADIKLEGAASYESILNATTVTTTSGLNITAKLPNVVGQLVKYSLDENGYIDGIEIVKGNTEGSALKAKDVDAMVSDDTIVFNAADGKYGVVKTSNIKDGNAYVVIATEGVNKGLAEVIVAHSVQSVNDGTYGVIKSVSLITNSAGKAVKEVVALVDGEEVTYVTNTSLVNNAAVAKTTTNQAIKFSFTTSDVMNGVADANTGIVAKFHEYSGAVSSLSYNGMTIGGVHRFFASDCVVYIYDQSDKAWTIGDVTDLDDDPNYVVATSAYVYDSTETTNFNMVIQIVK